LSRQRCFVPEPAMAVERVSVSYGPEGNRVPALSEVSLTFTSGAVTLIMGPSGSGKTTLLSLLGCLMTPDSGSVFVNGIDTGRLTDRKRTELRRTGIGFIFQAFRLFRSLSAFENVMLSAEIAGARERGSKTAKDLLARLGLGDKLHLKPDALSGGEKQRVAIARALLSNPRILLADEPTAALDSNAGRQICEILRRLADDEQRTVVVVSHDNRWANFAHRTVVLEDGRVTTNEGHT
jgi:putative ABC transport system ATP-binding protein